MQLWGFYTQENLKVGGCINVLGKFVIMVYFKASHRPSTLFLMATLNNTNICNIG